MMDPMLEDFAAVVAGLTLSAPRIALVSNVTGRVESELFTDACYWVRHVREAVRFADGVAAVRAAGGARFLEVGPDAALAGLIEAEAVVAVARRGRDEVATLMGAVALAHCYGVAVDWNAVFTGRGARRVDLPGYAFQHQRYWLSPQPATDNNLHHPILTSKVELAGGRCVFDGVLSIRSHPWIADHVLLGVIVVPGTGFVEMAMAAGAQVGCELLDELTLEVPLTFDSEEMVRVQVSVGDLGPDGRRPMEIYSRLDTDDADWTRHTTGAVGPVTAPDPHSFADLATWPPPGAEPIPVDDVYTALAGVGFDYGPTFRVVRAAWRRDGALFTEVALDGDHAGDAADYGVHPGLFDAVVHGGAMVSFHGTGAGRMLFSWNGVRRYSSGSSALRVRIADGGESTWTVEAVDERGDPVLSVDTLVHRPVETHQLTGRRAAGGGGSFVVDWVSVGLPVSVGGVSVGGVVDGAVGVAGVLARVRIRGGGGGFAVGGVHVWGGSGGCGGGWFGAVGAGGASGSDRVGGYR